MFFTRTNIYLGLVLIAMVYAFGFSSLVATEYRSGGADVPDRYFPLPKLDTTDYDLRLLALAHLPTSTPFSSLAFTEEEATSTASSTRLWPVRALYPNSGALLPFKRIVAYYGNFYSAGMGVLGEYPPATVLAMLASTTAEWALVDPSTPVLPAVQYIAVVAQGTPGKEGKYILRMPDSQIDKALLMARQVHGVLFLDIQVGKSTLEHELPLLESYLSMPDVHLAIDPEFSMKTDRAPGTVIGTFDAADINFAAEYLASLVRTEHLPPKILVVHRFTEDMVTNFEDIHPLPEVEIVMDMDGWGSQAKKKGTYNSVIAPEPVQFTGVKLFYKNDMKPPSTGLLTTKEVMSLTPSPIYIQYQ